MHYLTREWLLVNIKRGELSLSWRVHALRGKASGIVAGFVLEHSGPIAVHSKRPPVITTPHHLAFHKLIVSYKVHIYILFPLCSQTFSA